MPECRLKLINKLGLHARAASKLANKASRFHCDITLSKDGQEVNGKSIIGLMTLAAPCGAELLLRAEGSEAEEALKAMAELVGERFGEGE